MKMMLLTQENKKQLPPLYAQDGKGMEAIVYVKFFDPTGSWTWYVTEFDGEDTFFGFVCGFFNEFGYFSLNELKHCKDGQKGLKALPIERDLHWKPTPLKDCIKE
jgi:hypothetical protein